MGEATAAAARAAGFAVAQTGEGGLQPVVETLPPGHYLRLAGQDRVTLSPPGAVRIATQVVYAAQPRPIGADLPRGCIRGQWLRSIPARRRSTLRRNAKGLAFRRMPCTSRALPRALRNWPGRDGQRPALRRP
ncbi:hypothetical protein ACFQGS_22980 [Novosphingobium lubricantis]